MIILNKNLSFSHPVITLNLFDFFFSSSAHIFLKKISKQHGIRDMVVLYICKDNAREWLWILSLLNFFVASSHFISSHSIHFTDIMSVQETLFSVLYFPRMPHCEIESGFVSSYALMCLTRTWKEHSTFTLLFFVIFSLPAILCQFAQRFKDAPLFTFKLLCICFVVPHGLRTAGSSALSILTSSVH